MMMNKTIMHALVVAGSLTMTVAFFAPSSSSSAASSFVAGRTSSTYSSINTAMTTFVTKQPRPTTSVLLKAAESEVSFDSNLDGSNMRIGIIRTRWNAKHVENLVQGIRSSLKDCKVADDNIFETSVPGSFELPMAARFLALSGTVDAIICCGVLIKGETMHFEYIADAVAKGIMNTGLQTSTPIVFGVLTCLTEQQVVSRSSGKSNHGCDWGKTAVEMAMLRTEAMGGKTVATESLKKLGFGAAGQALKEETERKKVGFF